MAVNKKWKSEVKERVRLSNEAESKGLPPDLWVVEFRKKNNAIKSAWKAKQPRKEPKKKTANSGSFKKGLVPHNTKTPEEREISLNRWRKGSNQWHKDNREKVNERRRERRKNDPSFRMLSNLRRRLSYLVSLHSAKKSKQTLSLLGCDMPFFLNHLKYKFTEGMTFDNYGEWHIDHIKPCDLFDFTIKEHQEQCFHYTNLQPLWSIDNRIKSNKVLKTTPT